MYIASQSELEAFVERSRSSHVLAIDTEFLREKTYYPKLCLLQMATDDEDVVVDPFAVEDLTVLKPLLLDEGIMKVFHSGRQDIEIIFYEIGCIPQPLFDTQVAAALLGRLQQVGYGALVHSVCGVRLKKMDSFTDWSARPLSESQLSYAREDVIYLPQMYEAMTSELEEKGRLSWLDAELEPLTLVETYQEDERERFRRLKHVTQLNQRQMAVARELAAWREIAARTRNIPRKWVLTDEQIVEACKREPRTIDDLFMVRGVRERVSTRDARQIVELVCSALDSPPSAWPEIVNANRNEANVDVQVDMLMALVHMCAQQNDIAVPTLASHSDLTEIARGHYKDANVMKGWRRELIGNDLRDLLEGRTRLRIEAGKPLVETP